MIEVREVLRAWLAGQVSAGLPSGRGDRQTARRMCRRPRTLACCEAAAKRSFCDELIGQVVQQVHPARCGGHGVAWAALEAEQVRIAAWVKQGLTVAKIGVLLQRRGVAVPYRTLHPFCVERCGSGRTASTVRVADGEPGKECQLDLARMGLL